MKSQLKPLRDQVVVVFGASSGIGRETALRFAREGAKVVISARGEEGLQSLAKEIRSEGGETWVVPADARSFDEVKNVADETVNHFGRLDTWVHTAAVSLYATFEDTTPEEFKTLIEVNLLGQAYGAMAALPHIKNTGRGSLIHISSVEGKRALPYQSAYAASKHGIIGFLDALRAEIRKEGLPINVVNIMPAGINTPLFNHARTKIGVKPKPVPPVYQPNLVADMILYAACHPMRDVVAGGAAKVFITGQTFMPNIMDSLLLVTSFKGQRSKEPKTFGAPDNLHAPLNDHNTVEGDFSASARNFSLYNWLQRHRLMHTALQTVFLGGLGFLATHALPKFHKRTARRLLRGTAQSLATLAALKNNIVPLLTSGPSA